MSVEPLPSWARERVENLRSLRPQLTAKVHFYAPSDSKRRGSIANGYGCACAPGEDARRFYDARLLFDQDWVALGETVRAEFFFLYGDEAAAHFLSTDRFYLREIEAIGEAQVISRHY